MFEPLAFGVAEELPAVPAGNSVCRAALTLGTDIPVEADDLSVGLVYVEAGSLTARVNGPIAIMRGAAATAMTGGSKDPGAEHVVAGAEFTLEVGDSAVSPPNVAGEILGDMAGPAIAVAALVEPSQGDDAGAPASQRPASGHRGICLATRVLGKRWQTRASAKAQRSTPAGRGGRVRSR